MTLQLSQAERRLLASLPGDGQPVPLTEAAERGGFGSPDDALRAAGGPERHGLVERSEEVQSLYGLSEEGLRYREAGLPERRAAEAIRAVHGGLPVEQLADAADLSKPEVGIAIGWLKRKGWATIDSGTLQLQDAREGPDEALLATLSTEPAPVDAGEGLEMLLQRGGVLIERETKSRSLALTSQGQEFVRTLDEQEDGFKADDQQVNQVTPELVAKWHDMGPEQRAKVQLRPFDFDVPVAARYPGKAHPLTGIIDEIRDIFLSMGFTQIAGDYVESAFWNMDALFIPQDHPAREMQDTFYLKEPATAPVDEDDLARGKAIHLDGGETGSTGWGGSFDEQVSRRALLRTHTTNTTVRHLHETYSQDRPEEAHKVFGIGKVFRKETMDATHLPEFYQIEGIVTEPGANFNMLVGLAREFFTRMGFPDVRFRPAYFPYTEPSMEVDVLYNGNWMELGGSGVFRPEVTEPLGVGHPVLAWGLGLERLAMMRLGLKDIRDLYVSDIQWLRETSLQ